MLRPCRHGCQQLVGELAAYGRADLGQLLGRGEAVEARQKQVVQRRRDRQRGEGTFQFVAIAGVDQQAGLEHLLGQFLDEERDAVRPLQNLRADFRRKRFGAGQTIDHRRSFVACQASQLHPPAMRQLGPGRLEAGARSDQQEYAALTRPLDRKLQQFEARRVDPVNVLIDHQHRLQGREPDEPLDHRFERHLLLKLRRKVEARIATILRKPHGGRDQRHHRGHVIRPERHHGLELGQLGLCRVMRLEVRGALELVYQRVERAACMMRRALEENGDVAVLLEAGAQLPHEPGLADTRLAAQHDDLALALLGDLPAPKQLRHLVVAPDEIGEAERMTRVETALRRSLARDLPHLLGLGEALQLLRAEVDEFEQAAHQPAGRGADYDRARLGEGLDPCGKVGRLADDEIGNGALAHDLVADHHGTGRDADAHAQPDIEARCEMRNGPGCRDARAHRALRIILMRLGPAEIDDDRITGEFRDIAAKPTDNLGAGALIRADHVAQILRIELDRQLR